MPGTTSRLAGSSTIWISRCVGGQGASENVGVVYMSFSCMGWLENMCGEGF